MILLMMELVLEFGRLDKLDSIELGGDGVAICLRCIGIFRSIEGPRQGVLVHVVELLIVHRVGKNSILIPPVVIGEDVNTDSSRGSSSASK